MGNTQIGRTGLGYIKIRKRFNHEKQQNCREFLEVLRKAEREISHAKEVQQSVQGQWSKWQGYIKRDMSWHNLLKSTPCLVSFCLKATCNTLASPQKWARWGFEDDILSVEKKKQGCQKTLQSGRYTFRHKEVLTVIAHEMQVMINQVKKEVRKVCKDRIISFVSNTKRRQGNIASQEFYMKQKIWG